MDEVQTVFLAHLLRRRLDRVPPEYLRLFLEKQQIDLDGLKNKRDLLNALLVQYSIMKSNAEFNEELNSFLRDYVLSAGVSEYIIQVNSTDEVLAWIRSWVNGIFWGQKHKFEVHALRHLGQKFIEFKKDGSGNLTAQSLEIESVVENKDGLHGVSLPTDALFLVASSLEAVSELNGLTQVEYHRTSEFEVVFRKGSSLVEIRGDYKVIKDFVATAIMDNDNPMSMAASLFIGEEEDIQNSPTKKLRKRIGIESLREALDGSFLSIAAIVNGSNANRVKINLEGLRNWQEESDPLLRELIKQVQTTLDKGRIMFEYNEKKYSFMITKTGGLRFFEYVPEEVVTYVLHAIEGFS